MHIPERTCAVCRRKFPKSELIRIARTADGFCVDAEHKLGGRGVYVCANPECVAGCVRKKALNRSFRTEVGEKVYAELVAYAGKGK